MDKLLKEFSELKTDREKWIWVMENQDKDIYVHLDNDCTCISVGEYEGEIEYFNDYIGWAEGVFALLDVMGIRVAS